MGEPQVHTGEQKYIWSLRDEANLPILPKIALAAL